MFDLYMRLTFENNQIPFLPLITLLVFLRILNANHILACFLLDHGINIQIKVTKKSLSSSENGHSHLNTFVSLSAYRIKLGIITSFHPGFSYIACGVCKLSDADRCASHTYST